MTIASLYLKKLYGNATGLSAIIQRPQTRSRLYLPTNRWINSTSAHAPELSGEKKVASMWVKSRDVRRQIGHAHFSIAYVWLFPGSSTYCLVSWMPPVSDEVPQTDCMHKLMTQILSRNPDLSQNRRTLNVNHYGFRRCAGLDAETTLLLPAFFIGFIRHNPSCVLLDSSIVFWSLRCISTTFQPHAEPLNQPTAISLIMGPIATSQLPALVKANNYTFYTLDNGEYDLRKMYQEWRSRLSHYEVPRLCRLDHAEHRHNHAPQTSRLPALPDAGRQRRENAQPLAVNQAIKHRLAQHSASSPPTDRVALPVGKKVPLQTSRQPLLHPVTNTMENAKIPGKKYEQPHIIIRLWNGTFTKARN